MILEVEDWYDSCITDMRIGIKMTSMLFINFWQWSTVIWSLVIRFWMLLFCFFALSNLFSFYNRTTVSGSKSARQYRLSCLGPRCRIFLRTIEYILTAQCITADGGSLQRPKKKQPDRDRSHGTSQCKRNIEWLRNVWPTTKAIVTWRDDVRTSKFAPTTRCRVPGRPNPYSAWALGPCTAVVMSRPGRRGRH